VGHHDQVFQLVLHDFLVVSYFSVLHFLARDLAVQVEVGLASVERGMSENDEFDPKFMAKKYDLGGSFPQEKYPPPF
jgi:hypothetical protein